MSGCTTKGAGAATDDTPRPPEEPPSWREDWRWQSRALPLATLSGARGASRPSCRGGHRLFGAALLDGRLRAQGQQPDLRAPDAMVATPGTVGQFSTRAALSGFPLPPLPGEQHLLCWVGEHGHGAVLCR